jgi:hypothetical protein
MIWNEEKWGFNQILETFKLMIACVKQLSLFKTKLHLDKLTSIKKKINEKN